jgi:hypothetical protein
VRSAGVQALSIIADEHPDLRTDVVTQLRACLQDVDGPDRPVITAALRGLVALGDNDSRDVLVQAIEDWHLSPFEFRVEDVDRDLREYAEPGQLSRHKRDRYLPKDNLHGALEWWAAFDENRNRSIFGRGPT